MIFSSMSIDELIASTKEEIARIDQMMGTSRLPQQEDAQEPAPQQGAPQAGEVSLDDETDDKAKPSQSEPFEPKLPEEYADLSLDSDEQPEQDEQPQRAHLAAGVKVLLYVCCVLAASVLLAVFGWRLADDVLALTKPDEEITITVPENATVADVSRELKEKGLIEYEWLFRFYCLYSHAERKIQPGTYELNHLYDYHALVNGMTPSAGVRATTEVTIPEGYECEDIFALLEEAGVASAADLEQAAANYEFDYAFLQDLPYGDKNRLEGYLFPDTYQFYLNDKPENVLGRFLRNFESKITDDMYAALDELNAKLEEKMRANGFEESEIESAKLSFHDVVIVASLVEKETAKRRKARRLRRSFITASAASSIRACRLMRRFSTRLTSARRSSQRRQGNHQPVQHLHERGASGRSDCESRHQLHPRGVVSGGYGLLFLCAGRRRRSQVLEDVLRAPGLPGKPCRRDCGRGNRR